MICVFLFVVKWNDYVEFGFRLFVFDYVMYFVVNRGRVVLFVWVICD